MFSTRSNAPDPGAVLDRVMQAGPGAPPLEERLRLLEARRALGDGALLDRFFIEEVTRLRLGLAEAHAHQAKLKAVLDTLTASPWHPGVFLGAALTVEGERAMVLHGGVRRVVPLAEGLSGDDLRAGDDVLLANN